MRLHFLGFLVVLGLVAAGCTTKLADGLPNGDRCAECHGNQDNAAPPRAAVDGKTTADREVGAHQVHLRGGFALKPLPCDSCHVVPTNVEDEGHIDHASPEHPSDPADVTFGAFASTGGLTPSWNRADATCASVYCHGATLSGGKRTTPTWTYAEQPDYLVQLNAESCAGCHGAPPPLPHPVRTDCETCHPTTVTSALHVMPGGTHLDGKIDIAQGCHVCHGSLATPAPPMDLHGNEVTTARGVGAHQAHLAASTWRAPITCEACHLVPATRDAPGHLDSPLPAELTWGSLAQARDAGPEWDPAALTCSGAYCHGAKTRGGTLKTPEWTKVDGTQAACGTCHGVPPAGHLTAACHHCHPSMATDGGFAQPGLHVDGKVDVLSSGECGVCHPVPPTTGTHAAHYSEPGPTPAATYGDLRTVGDYADGGRPEYQFGCGHCHPLDPARHLDGEVQVELSNPGAPTSSLKARTPASATWDPATGTCANVYCHSSGQASPAYVSTPGWRSGARLACDGCHGNPPAYPTGDAGSPTANTHLVLSDDGYELGHFGGLPGPWHTSYHGEGPSSGYGSGAITCQACHYATTNPQDTGPSGFYWLNTTGRYELDGGLLGYRCGSCHAPGSTTAPPGTGRVLPLKHVNGARDVVFDPRTTLPASYTGLVTTKPTSPFWVTTFKGMRSHDLADAGYDPATKTCSNVSCHLQQSQVQWGLAPNGWSTCNNCHQY